MLKNITLIKQILILNLMFHQEIGYLTYYKNIPNKQKYRKITIVYKYNFLLISALTMPNWNNQHIDILVLLV